MVTLFLIGGIWLWSLGIKAETTFSPNYTAQQLERILAGNGAEKADDFSEQPTYSGLEFTVERNSEQATEIILASYSDSIFQTSDYLNSNWEIYAASQNWLNLNRGDGSKELVRIVIFRF